MISENLNKHVESTMVRLNVLKFQLVVKEKSPSTFGVNNKIVNGVFNPDFLKQVYDMMVDIESLNGSLAH